MSKRRSNLRAGILALISKDVEEPFYKRIRPTLRPACSVF